MQSFCRRMEAGGWPRFLQSSPPVPGWIFATQVPKPQCHRVGNMVATVLQVVPYKINMERLAWGNMSHKCFGFIIYVVLSGVSIGGTRVCSVVWQVVWGSQCHLDTLEHVWSPLHCHGGFKYLCCCILSQLQTESNDDGYARIRMDVGRSPYMDWSEYLN